MTTRPTPKGRPWRGGGSSSAGGRLRHLAGLIVLTATASAAGAVPVHAQQETGDGCIDCHQSLGEERLSQPARAYLETDIHAQRGFGCLACHGPTPEHDPARGFLAKPTRRRIPELCGRCHSDAAFMRDYNPALRVDQVAEYLTSVHGQRLMEANDTAVATCVNCHPAHQIRPPSQPQSTVHPLNVAGTCATCHADSLLMGPRGVRTDPVQRYRASVHATLLYETGDLSAPTCNDCHGNHGAAPPGVASVRNVCGQCHATMAEQFARSGHVQTFEEAGRPGCVTCHGNHDVQTPSDDFLAERNQDVCRACHDSPGDPHANEFLAMRALIDSLEGEAQRGLATLREAENRGMEVSTALFELDDVGDALIKARSAVHTFHLESVATEVGAGLVVTGAAQVRGQEALDEHGYRRVGLAFSVSIILVLIGGLVFKIRELDALGGTAAAGAPAGPSSPVETKQDS